MSMEQLGNRCLSAFRNLEANVMHTLSLGLKTFIIGHYRHAI